MRFETASQVNGYLFARGNAELRGTLSIRIPGNFVIVETDPDGTMHLHPVESAAIQDMARR